MPEMRFSNGALAVPDEAAARGPATVLVVEDDDVDFAVIRDLLIPTGRLVERAPDLAAARHRVSERERPVDLVVADLYLPDGWPMTTFDALADLGQGQALIVVSGCSSDVRLLEYRARPDIAIFDKNVFDRDAFLAAVRTALDRRDRLDPFRPTPERT